MIRNLRNLAILALSVLALQACSNKNDSSDGDSGQTVETSAPAILDMEKIEALAEKDGKDITKDDCDFILDQLEIIADRVSGMSKEEARNYFETLSSDEGMAMIVLSMGAESAAKKGLFTDSQMKRYQKLQEKYGE